jgi:hypothetical protein
MPDAQGSARIKDLFHFVDVEDLLFGAGPLKLWKLEVEGVARLVLIKVVQVGLHQSHSCLG